MAEAVAEEYRSSLCDLNFNSKPHINMLTMLAEENVKFAPIIVKTIVSHIATVPSNLKLPSLYLVDSIMKNIGGQYITLFCDHMITLFSSVFEKVEETTRSSLYKLRQTWNDILPKKILYGIDCNVNHIDPAWPITAKVPLAKVSPPPPKSPIHVNPKFLGAPTSQPSNPPINSTKSTVAKKNESGPKDKEKEVMEIKKKQEEMLRLIEEKKGQLKALEQKKMEMAAKQKKKNLNIASLLAQQTAAQFQKKAVNHRDPRLKKAVPVAPLVNDKPSPIALQSVVIVPKLPGSDVLNNNGNVKSLQKSNSKNETPSITVGNKAFLSEEISESPNRKTNNLPKKTSRGVDENKASENPTKDIYNTKREHLDRTSKVSNKKHPLNPEETVDSNAKRFCKLPVNKSKRPLPVEAISETESYSKNDNHPIKKGKHVSYRSKNKLTDHPNSRNYSNEAISVGEQRLETPILFGTEDKDYRQHGRPAVNSNSKQWHQPEVTPHTNARISQEPFYPMEQHKVADLPASEPSENFYSCDGITPHNAVGRRIPDDNYQSTKMTDFKPDLLQTNKFPHPEHSQMKKLIDPSSVLKKEMSDQNYNLAPPIPVPNTRLSPPPLKQFTLDGINCNLYFVDEHAFVMNENEPREVIFRGPLRNVHVEGLSQPILLGFDGRTVEFETEGKLNTIRFGTPSREIYINNFPHEAQFGGAPFTVLLEDKKLHRVKIDGPPPQVVVNKLSNELYDLFHRSRGMLQQPSLGPDQSKAMESSVLLHDVDMRVKPSHNLKSSILPDSKKDVDWRHVTLTDAPKVPWDVPENSFETYKDYDPSGKGRNFKDSQTASMVPNAPTQWNDNNRVLGDRSAPERSNNMGGPWPRPAFRPMMAERPRFDPPMHPNQRPTWDMQSVPALPPPPSIPPSLSMPSAPPNLPSLAALSNLPNLSVPPPSWNPLPPPPRFPGQVPDPSLPSSVLNPAPSVSSIMQNSGLESTLPTVPTLPINVETIYDKLVAAGIITKKTATEEPRVATPENTKEESQPGDKDSETKEEIPDPEVLLLSKSLKTYHPHVIFALYKGSQCATCGMRFKEIQSEQYSRHLDWHFRMNRREKDGAKKAYSRRLFYEIKDWIQFKEIEEAEERTPSYFELQADGDSSRNEEQEKIQSVPASECESEKCSVCSEAFQLFWVEDEEEWHLRHAVRHDGEAYHPMCYEDFKKAEEMANRTPEPPEEEPDEKPSEEMDTAGDITEEVDGTIKSEPDDVKPDPVMIKIEMNNIETAESEDAKLSEDSIIKKEPLDNDETTAPSQNEGENVTDALVPEATGTKSMMEVEEPVAPPPPQTIESLAFQSSDIDSDNFEDDFRPPTPDPRFQVLPPVEKGKELSALCTIM